MKVTSEQSIKEKHIRSSQHKSQIVCSWLSPLNILLDTFTTVSLWRHSQSKIQYVDKSSLKLTVILLPLVRED